MNYIPKIEYIELITGTPKTIQFVAPPESDPFNEKYTVSSTVTKSNNGQKQTAYNYTRKEYTLDFIFQSKAIKDSIVDFFNNHASRGGKFNYFAHSDEVDFEVFEIEGKKLALSRPIPSATNDFEYDFKLKISRVI